MHFMPRKCKLWIVENTNTRPTTQLRVADASYRLIDLPAAAGARLTALPVVLRLLLENVLRHREGAEREAAASALLAWPDTGTSEAEIAFQPGRVLMHDTTSTPALVDIAAMRDAIAEAGADPGALNPTLPVDVSVDHSLAVEAYARADAPVLNLQHELRRNAERYRFLRWASTALQGVRIHPPGTGIMHTINLEQLATVVTTETRDGELWAVPDMMLGTDSHTPMVNGIGVLGWGVGGLEAQTVMFGVPTVLRIPDVIGVRLTGRLGAGVQATDLALTVTQRLRAIGVAGEFVEFFGPGVSTLSAVGQPESGAPTSLALRAGARLGARHRGPRHRQPDRTDLVRRDDARLPRPPRRARRHRRRDRARARCRRRRAAHARPRRPRGDARARRGDRARARTGCVTCSLSRGKTSVTPRKQGCESP